MQCSLAPKQGYAGDVTPLEAWEMLTAPQGAMLVDVRTVPEWQFIGQPSVKIGQSSLASISWKHYPNFSLNTDFATQLANAGATADTILLFLCRSGGRSSDAASAMTDAGYTQCYNISGGFEGEQDANGHRGQREGWKSAGLPWTQG